MKKNTKRTYNLESGRSRTISGSLNDLITHSEDAVSSQATVFTQNSQRDRNAFSQSFANIGDFDEYEDIMNEEIDTLFITPEEEKKIQDILQFARKGKINPGNAFEIPVRVIDAQLTESSNNRFWKFASELLYASMNIYDKRVQNMLQNTNRMFDNLIRVQGKPDKPLTDDQLQQKSRRQRNQLIHMDINEVGKISTMASYQIGTVNCDEEKINIKNLNNQFIPDPMFNKTLQAFDSNTLKCLFMNVFQCGDNLEITFFKNKQMDQKMDIQISEEMKEMKNQLKTNMEVFPAFIEAELGKIGVIAQTCTMFENIDKLIKDIFKDDFAQNKHNRIKGDFAAEISRFRQGKTNENPHELQYQSQQDHSQHTDNFNEGNHDSFHFNSISKQFNQVSMYLNEKSQQTHSSHLPQSQKFQSNYDLFFNDFQDNYSQMTPWELQFKGSKLIRKRATKPKHQTSAKQKKSKKISLGEGQINFMDGITQTRKLIINPKPTTTTTINNNAFDRFLAQKSMQPFMQAHKKNRKMEKRDYQIRTQNYLIEHRLTESRKLEMEHDEGNEETQSFYNQADDNRSNIFDQNDSELNTQSNLLVFNQNSKQFATETYVSVRNIRQIKEKIYRNIVISKKLKLSEINLPVSPSSILVIFLHLINEKDIQIQSIDNESDILITLKQQ